MQKTRMYGVRRTCLEEIRRHCLHPRNRRIFSGEPLVGDPGEGMYLGHLWRNKCDLGSMPMVPYGQTPEGPQRDHQSRCGTRVKLLRSSLRVERPRKTNRSSPEARVAKGWVSSALWCCALLSPFFLPSLQIDDQCSPRLVTRLKKSAPGWQIRVRESAAGSSSPTVSHIPYMCLSWPK